jgi:hypothetical protein
MMPAKVPPAAVRESLATALDPVLAPHGFRRVKLTHLGWQRALGPALRCVFLPLGKYGWSADTGASFQCQLQEGPDAHPFSNNHTRFAWIHSLLGPDDLEAGRAINNRVAMSLPDPYVEDPVAMGLVGDVHPVEWAEKYTNVIDWTRWDVRFATDLTTPARRRCR